MVVDAFIFTGFTGMAAGARKPLSIDADAEVLEQIPLTAKYAFVMAAEDIRAALPCPMGWLHHTAVVKRSHQFTCNQ
jgi:hypothetical protein